MRGALGYLASRLGTTLLVVLGALLLLFALTLLVPGDPAQTLLGPRATPDAIAAFRLRMGLDRPVLERFGHFLWQVLQGDLGTDIVSGRPIAAMVMEVLPYTVTLTAVAIGLALLLGVPLGCYAATHPGSRGDRLSALLSVGVIAVPNFVIAIFLILVFSIWLHALPVLGTAAMAEEAGSWAGALWAGALWGSVSRLVLPSLALALSWVGYLARLMRASLVEVLGEPYIRTSRAYGLSERRIVLKYALRNAAIPTLAVLGLGVGQLLGGAVFIEIIFARPGIGKLVFDAIGQRNYPVIEACVLVVVLLFVATNLAVDLLFLWLDPRLREGVVEAPSEAGRRSLP